MTRFERILEVVNKHNGIKVDNDINRVEFDYSIVYELLALEDYIKELEQEINRQELIIVNLQTQIKLPELNRENFNKFISKKRGSK